MKRSPEVVAGLLKLYAGRPEAMRRVYPEISDLDIIEATPDGRRQLLLAQVEGAVDRAIEDGAIVGDYSASASLIARHVVDQLEGRNARPSRR